MPRRIPFPIMEITEKPVKKIAKETGNYYIDMNKVFKDSGLSKPGAVFYSVFVKGKKLTGFIPMKKGLN